MLTLVAMADTHTFHDDLDVPDGDILIHAGDLSRSGSLEQLETTRDFLIAQPHRHKIVVAGNHDRAFETHPYQARDLFKDLIYLQDESCVIEGVKFYGSPWTPAFLGWAFNLPRGVALREKWALIPADVDVLITHGPPRGIGDNSGFVTGRAGCAELLERVREIEPALHLFGHIHQDRGKWRQGATTFVNVSTDECLAPVTVISYPPEQIT